MIATLKYFLDDLSSVTVLGTEQQQIIAFGPEGTSKNSNICLTACTVGNLGISEPSLGILEKFQHRLDPLNIKYNYTVLFLRQTYSLFINASKCFSHRPPL